ncbi:bacillithiol biosynthesis cysteine-adding enzyme BshC [Parvicella tangerina]|uniref:Putative cysteine ligase BshC n=1 Tax=Parvicella tangerina TaxID=2829795 RepID=A0A916JLQ5_9FLAO|nr:bacillithiol biosynthesis cysteine-adding enzyme BshC [Parvicella tangerina]CAG5080354.1 Putative cysteine ligase BshC [Parvicella tangerina]
MSNSSCAHIPRVGGTKLIQDYISGSEKLKPFIEAFPDLDELLDKASRRVFSEEDRKTLFDAVSKQYEQAGMITPSNWSSIKQENAFTITTGHQLSLFGGPKYFIYKIVSVLKLVKSLNESQQELNFLPIFWMASEDHDFDEVNQVKIFDHVLSSNQQKTGPMGRIDPDTFDSVFEELKEILGTSQEATELIQLFTDAFEQRSWASFTRYWVNEIFNGEVIIIDGDDRELKKMFVPVVHSELNEQITDKKVTSTNEQLEELGYHIQVSHRAVNLFYIEDGIRERIGYLNGQHKVHNLSRCLKRQDVINHPESISPNALLRPVYQETILPNIAYVGGPGELAYWFQLKALFTELKTSFPLLVLRDSFLFVKEKDELLLEKLGMGLSDLQHRDEQLQKEYILKNGLKQIDFAKEREDLNEIISQLNTKVSEMHRNYHPMIEAERAKIEKFINKLEVRAMRDAKFREELNINKLLKLRATYFPGGGLVERTSSFMEEYISLGKQLYMELLMDASNPLDSRIKVITVNK